MNKSRQISPEPAKPPTTVAFKDYQSQYQRPKSPFTRSYSNHQSRTEEKETPKFSSRTDKPFVFTGSKDNYPEKRKYSPPATQHSSRSDYRPRYEDRNRSTSRSNYTNYRQSSQNRSSTPYRSHQRSPSYSRDYSRNYNGQGNNYRSDNYRSSSRNRSKSHSGYDRSRRSNEPNTEKITFSNQDKSIFLTMVENHHLKN